MRHNLLLDVIGFAIAGGTLAYHRYFSRDAIVKRGLGKVPRGRLGRVVAGRAVKVVGRLDCVGEPVVAPLTQRRCAYYELTIEEWRNRGRSGDWVTIVQQASGRDFVVRDGKVAALVHTNAAEIAVHKDEQDVTGILKAPTPELEALLEQYGEKATGLLGFSRRLRFREGVLEAGEHVAVCGAPVRYAGTPPGAAIEAAGGRPIEWVFDQYGEIPLYVSDDPATLIKPRAS